MSDTIYHVLGLASLGTLDRLVLVTVVEFEDRGYVINASYLRKVLQIGRLATVTKAINDLGDAGYLDVRKPEGGSGESYQFSSRRDFIRDQALNRWKHLAPVSRNDRGVSISDRGVSLNDTRGLDHSSSNSTKEPLVSENDRGVSLSDRGGNGAVPPDPFGARFHAERVERQQQRREQNASRPNLTVAAMQAEAGTQRLPPRPPGITQAEWEELARS